MGGSDPKEAKKGWLNNDGRRGRNPRAAEDKETEDAVEACKGDMGAARDRWSATCRWREENRVEAILQDRGVWKHFAHIKAKYPHCFHGRSLDGMPVYYEKPAIVDLEALDELGVGLDELLRHNIAIFEFMWRHVAPSETVGFEHAQVRVVLWILMQACTALMTVA